MENKKRGRQKDKTAKETPREVAEKTLINRRTPRYGSRVDECRHGKKF